MPRSLHIGRQSTKNYLSNADIAGSKPNITKFKTNRQSCNPLNPTYKLQGVEHVPAPIPKFIRDGISNTDIDGAQPRKIKHKAPRDSFNVNDIDGSKPKRTFFRKFVHDQFYDDVSKVKKF